LLVHKKLIMNWNFLNSDWFLQGLKIHTKLEWVYLSHAHLYIRIVIVCNKVCTRNPNTFTFIKISTLYVTSIPCAMLQCRHLPRFHCAGPGPIPGQSMWDSWWIMCTWDNFWGGLLNFPHQYHITYAQNSFIHSFTYHSSYVILAIRSIVE